MQWCTVFSVVVMVFNTTQRTH
ncbi:hypothetical protein A2U01_0101557, partial [Trifolium medium]|nr:hypothetical protein [Trifolium medium]